MEKRGNINGIPNSLVESFLSSMNYYDEGHMACWLWKQANKLKIDKMEIDVLSESTRPVKLKSQPLVAHFQKLQESISKTLMSNDLRRDFIRSAKFMVWISPQNRLLQQISIQGIIKDAEGRKYESKIFQEQVYPIADSFFEKINGNIK